MLILDQARNGLVLVKHRFPTSASEVEPGKSLHAASFAIVDLPIFLFRA
jgi:hypothetical protein